MGRSTPLTLDSVVNLLLGAPLVVFPHGLVEFLGIPAAESKFYPSMLGAVLLGVVIALAIERFRRSRHSVGLGLAGAISINLCAGVALSLWLLWGGLSLTARGAVLLWSLVALLLVVSVLELVAQRTDHAHQHTGG